MGNDQIQSFTENVDKPQWISILCLNLNAVRVNNVPR